ncbi:MAG: hypothetical protein IPH53_02385 [Flavobacteriales bacterium]|nr:hypothetical protein [Flavobacteriales bacterium]
MTDILSANPGTTELPTGITGWSDGRSKGNSHTITQAGTMVPEGGLSNNSTYDTHASFKHTAAANITSGQWYRLRFSLQSNRHGELKSGFKGDTQITGPQMPP